MQSILWSLNLNKKRQGKMETNTMVEIFDSTLRDGAQGEGISFSVQDKLSIVKALDELGVSFIEAGNPGSNQRTWNFSLRQKIKLKMQSLSPLAQHGERFSCC